MEKCEKCGHNGEGLHLCRGGNIFKALLESKGIEVKGKIKDLEIEKEMK